MLNEPKNIKVVEGDGSNLEISPVYDHINNIQQPRKKQRQEIIIPKVKNNEKDKEKQKPENEEKNEEDAELKEDLENTLEENIPEDNTSEED